MMNNILFVAILLVFTLSNSPTQSFCISISSLSLVQKARTVSYLKSGRGIQHSSRPLMIQHSSSSFSSSNDFDRMRDFFVGREDGVLDWYDMEECQVLFPVNGRIPRSIIHFIGGFLAGSVVKASYQSLLEGLALQGHLIVARLPPHWLITSDLRMKFPCLKSFATDLHV
jgi:hypothetical protein